MNTGSIVALQEKAKLDVVNHSSLTFDGILDGAAGRHPSKENTLLSFEEDLSEIIQEDAAFGRQLTIQSNDITDFIATKKNKTQVLESFQFSDESDALATQTHALQLQKENLVLKTRLLEKQTKMAKTQEKVN